MTGVTPEHAAPEPSEDQAQDQAENQASDAAGLDLRVAGADVSELNVPVPNVLVGVTAQQTDAVLLEAARLADRLDATLICATVDSGRYITDILPDGSVFTVPIDPDQIENNSIEFSSELADHVHQVLARLPRSDGSERPLIFRALVGDAALALAALAESAHSHYVVVGSRRSGIRAGMKEFFGGSIAVHLVHRQSRPVLVVPVDPVRAELPLPWEG